MAHSSLDEPTCSSPETQNIDSEEKTVEQDLSAPSMASKRASIAADSETETDEVDKQAEAGNATETRDVKGTEQAEESDDDEVDEANETEAETPKMAHDSMVTVRLSEPPSLTLDTTAAISKTGLTTPTSLVVEENIEGTEDDSIQTDKPSETHDSITTKSRDSTLTVSSTDASRSLQDELGQYSADGNETDSSEDNEEVNWEQLEKTEDEQMKDEETDNVRSNKLAPDTNLVVPC